MLSLLTYGLRCFSPETAHGLAAWGMKMLQWLRFKLLRTTYIRKPHFILPGAPALAFSNRLGLGAGFDKNAEFFGALATFGFGFIEVGTVTPIAQVGNPKPRLRRVAGQGLINHMGFNNCGLTQFQRNLARYRSHIRGVPLFANIGKNKDTPNERAIDDYQKGFSALSHLVDGFVVNVSSPNTPNLFALQSREFLTDLTRLIPVARPTLVKFSPDLEDAQIVELCHAVSDCRGIVGVVLTNTSRTFAEKNHGALVGGLSGPEIFSRALHCVELARRNLSAGKIIVGVGGIDCPEKANAMRLSGADLVEIYTSFVYRGPALVRRLAESLAK